MTEHNEHSCNCGSSQENSCDCGGSHGESCGSSGCNCKNEEEKKAPDFNNIKHVVAVMSGKGGVGKSSFASLLAIALNKKGYKVGILDADITGPSIPKLFGVKGLPDQNEKGVLPKKSKTGIGLMSINFLLPQEDEPVIWRGPIISGVIKQFWEEVIWDDLDYLIVDLPPGTGDAPLTVLQSLNLDGVLIVTSPQDLANMVVRKAIKMAQKMDIPVLGIVENMSYLPCPDCGKRINLFGESNVEKTCAELNVDLIGKFPLDPELASLSDKGAIEDYQGTNLTLLAENLDFLNN